ncbi:hypothetical protein KP509_1Z230500 [Ceratopteris richardii]|nr:hypothetical protein KP509_1Z230500 [Ceratopteris richardii]
MQSFNVPAPISSAMGAAISTALASSPLAPAYATTSSQPCTHPSASVHQNC